MIFSKKLLAAALALLLVCGCTAYGSLKIEDTAGADNIELKTITDENILNRDLPSGGYGARTSGLLSKQVKSAT